jgi:hypothetical protein
MADSNTNSGASSTGTGNTTDAGAASSGAGTETAVGNTSAEPSISEILAFDPFGPPAGGDKAGKADDKTTQKAAADVKAGKADQGTGELEPGKPPVSAAPAAPAKDTQPSALERTVQEQAELIRQLAQRGEQPGKTQDEPGKTKETAPKFNLGIPPQILDAIRSDDPKESAAGLHAVINGVANAVWNEAQKLIETTVQQVTEKFPQVIEQHTSLKDMQRKVHDEAFAPLVQNVGMLVAQDFARTGKAITWGPEMRDAIAERLFQMFPQMKTQPQPQQQQQQQTDEQKPKPRFNAGGGSPPGGVAKADEFSELLKI